MSDEKSNGEVTRSEISCRLELRLVDPAVLLNEPRSIPVEHPGDLLGNLTSPQFTLQDSEGLSDWIVVELTAMVKPLSETDRKRLRGTVHYRVFSNAWGVWTT